MKKIILAIVLLVTMSYAEMTPSCSKIANTIEKQVTMYAKLKAENKYELSHKLITKIVINMAWSPEVCNSENTEDAAVLKIIYENFNEMLKQKDELDIVFGKIEYK